MPNKRVVEPNKEERKRMNGTIAQLSATENERILFSKRIQSCTIKIIYKVIVSHLEGRDHSGNRSVHRKLCRIEGV